MFLSLFFLLSFFERSKKKKNQIHQKPRFLRFELKAAQTGSSSWMQSTSPVNEEAGDTENDER